MGSCLEKPVVFECLGESLYGILHQPEDSKSDIGVLIVVGGPQYRIGSHRQFLLLARALAERGIPVFRFDCRGMGDSTGKFPGFESIEDDIRAAIDAFVAHHPPVKKILIWGLCDGASAACFYAPADDRVASICIVNPWVWTEQGEAETYLKHYYLRRFISRDFWIKLFCGKFRIGKSIRELFVNLKRSLGRQEILHRDKNISRTAISSSLSLPERVFRSLKEFSGNVLIIVSGNDLTAAEFLDSIKKDRKRQKLIQSPRISIVSIPNADHTFSRRKCMEEAIEETAKWVASR